MRIRDLTTLKEFFDPAEGIASMLADFFISLKASGVQEIQTDSAIEEIRKRYGQDLTMEDLTTMYSEGKLPMVKDMNHNVISLDIRDSEIENKNVDNSKDRVHQMARQAASSAAKEI